MNPIIINNELSGSVHTTYDNGSSLDIDGANGNYFIIEAAASGNITHSNIAEGVVYTLQIHNVKDPAADIVITYPTAAGNIRSTPTRTIPTGKYLNIEVVKIGTTYVWSDSVIKEITV